ncbi:unnamed protein product [Prorocentrum cordatum]|uniref:Uncharacterized protein n=1 Tax=Prorocentrum cordatum TaxID=2364126 RepID=A0ABN9VX54_9DINO|nr:unnamed protein product [Polarella glacialis]
MGSGVLVEHRFLFAMLDVPGWPPLLAGVAYLYTTEGLSKRNLELLKMIGETLQGNHMAIFGADWNLGPTIIEFTGMLRKADMLILQPKIETCVTSKAHSRIDFFVVSPAVANMVDKTDVVKDWPKRPHRPVQLIFKQGSCLNDINVKVYAMVPFDGFVARNPAVDLASCVDDDTVSAYGAADHVVKVLGQAVEDLERVFKEDLGIGLNAQGKYLVKTVFCDGLWTEDRAQQAGYHSTGCCPLCGEPDSVTHRIYFCNSPEVSAARTSTGVKDSFIQWVREGGQDFYAGLKFVNPVKDMPPMSDQHEPYLYSAEGLEALRARVAAKEAKGFVQLTVGAYGPGDAVPRSGQGGDGEEGGEGKSLKSRVAMAPSPNRAGAVYLLTVRIHKAERLREFAGLLGQAAEGDMDKKGQDKEGLHTNYELPVLVPVARQRACSAQGTRLCCGVV